MIFIGVIKNTHLLPERDPLRFQRLPVDGENDFQAHFHTTQRAHEHQVVEVTNMANAEDSVFKFAQTRPQ